MNGDGRVGVTTGKVTPTLFAVVPTDTHAPTLFASVNRVVGPFLEGHVVVAYFGFFPRMP